MQSRALSVFWSRTEHDVAKMVTRRPDRIVMSEYLHKREKEFGNDALSQNLYSSLLPVLTRPDTTPAPLEKFKWQPICKLTLAPKNPPNDNLIANLIRVSSDEIKNMDHFFIVDESNRVLAYARFSLPQNTGSLSKAYHDLSFIAIDAIESQVRESYSLGTVLVQAVFEQGIQAGREGRMAVLSFNKSGGFYLKMGFTAINESIFDKLFHEKEQIDGALMFLTDAAIAAWKNKVKLHPLLPSSLALTDDVAEKDDKKPLL